MKTIGRKSLENADDLVDFIFYSNESQMGQWKTDQFTCGGGDDSQSYDVRLAVQSLE